jgi:hypothetical protein
MMLFALACFVFAGSIGAASAALVVSLAMTTLGRRGGWRHARGRAILKCLDCGRRLYSGDVVRSEPRPPTTE